MTVVRINARVSETVLDVDVMTALRRSMGRDAFDETFEDALCDVTERLSVIERAIANKDILQTSREALALSAVSTRFGLRAVGAVARNLHECCEADDIAAANAVAGRLARVGEKCVIAAAELSVDLGATAT